jgi:AcrR family transcriptional regulator
MRQSARQAPRRRLRKPQRRRSLLDAAVATFGASGYHATSLDAVAARAGVSKPVLYDHFPSKEALYVAVLEDLSERMLATLARHARPAAAGLEERLESAVAMLCRFVRHDPAAARLLFPETVSEPAVAAAHAAIRARSVQLVAELTASDPDFTAPRGLSRRRAALIMGELQYSACVAAATWVYDHPTVPVAHVVAVFMDFAWVGLERFRRGEHWREG